MAVILGRKGGGAASGGSLPDPSGEPDGDVLTVSGGAAVWSPGGGSLPAWWTVDSTPAAESVLMAGKIVLEPELGNDGDVPILAMLGRAADMVDQSNDGIFWGAQMLGGSGDWGSDFVYKFGVLDMRFKSPPDEGGAKFIIEAADTARMTQISDGYIVLKPNKEGGSTDWAQFAPTLLRFNTGPTNDPYASQIDLTYDDDDTTPLLVLTARTADGSLVSATIPLT